MFYQNGWDNEKTFQRGLTPEVESRYIRDDGVAVTVLAPQMAPEPGHWVKHGDYVVELIGEVLDASNGDKAFGHV